MTSRAEAIARAREIIANKPIYLDTETTGTDQSAEIIEICIINEDNHQLMNTVVKPALPIPSNATRIHGITNRMTQNAPIWPTIWPDVQRIISGKFVAVYNADFDLRLLRQTNRRYNILWDISAQTQFICIMRLYAQFYGDWNPIYQNYRWHSLENAGLQSKIKLKNSHRACEDTQLAKEILHFISNQIP